jgi:DUF971 family protein
MILKPENIVIMHDNIAIKWADGSESFIKNRQLREACPCANCSGESDVFGNVYKNNNQEHNSNNQQKYKISGYRHIGHYAIRVQWADGHNGGIYSFDLLSNLSVEK